LIRTQGEKEECVQFSQDEVRCDEVLPVSYQSPDRRTHRVVTGIATAGSGEAG
jgi:hypothetical protein